MSTQKMAEICLGREAENENKKLSDIFQESLSLYDQVTKSNESESSNKIQGDVKKCIQLLEQCTHLINAAGVFSSNEVIDEIPTTHIQFLLIPAFLGTLVLKLQSPDRISTLETAEVYFKDFLKRCQEYEIISEVKFEDENEKEGQGPPRKPDLNQMARERNEKIRKYKEQKELETELSRLKTLLSVNDDETSRNYYTLFIKSFVNVAFDEIKSIKQEKPLAQHMAELKELQQQGGPPEEHKKKDQIPYKPLKPIILTRNQLQKQVFGAGYPSLPTMTVSEFYEQRVAEGIFPAHGSTHNKTLQDLADPEISKMEEEKEEVRKEQEIESDDPNHLMKTRNMDDFKDDHKRGWGNRMNRS